MASSSWSGRTYAPTTDIAETAVGLADMIDAEGTYVVEELEVSDLPEVWFSPSRGTERLPATGCVSSSATLRGSLDRQGHGLLVFTAELPTDRFASELAARAATATTVERPRVASIHDRRIIIVIGGSRTHSEKAVETAESLTRFQVLSTRALERDAE